MNATATALEEVIDLTKRGMHEISALAHSHATKDATAAVSKRKPRKVSIRTIRKVGKAARAIFGDETAEIERLKKALANERAASRDSHAVNAMWQRVGDAARATGVTRRPGESLPDAVVRVLAGMPALEVAQDRVENLIVTLMRLIPNSLSLNGEEPEDAIIRRVTEIVTAMDIPAPATFGEARAAAARVPATFTMPADRMHHLDIMALLRAIHEALSISAAFTDGQNHDVMIEGRVVKVNDPRLAKELHDQLEGARESAADVLTWALTARADLKE